MAKLMEFFSGTVRSNEVQQAIRGIEFTKADIEKLHSMFMSEGWLLYKRLLDAIKSECVTATLGNLANNDDASWNRAKGTFLTVDELLAIEPQVNVALDELIAVEKENTKTP